MQGKGDDRPRVGDVSKFLSAGSDKNDKLMFAAFDLIQTEDGAPVPEIYSEKFSQIEKLLSGAKLTHPVKSCTVKNVEECKKLYTEWVEPGLTEGLVAHWSTEGYARSSLRLHWMQSLLDTPKKQRMPARPAPYCLLC